ncbi:hypothetical protein ACHWQZ_G018886 [Mnemiopsis leidyi]
MNTANVFAFIFVIFGLFESALSHECQPGYVAHNIEDSEDYECVRVEQPPPVPVALAPPRKQSSVAIEHAESEGCTTVDNPTVSNRVFSLDCPEGKAVRTVEMRLGASPEIECCDIGVSRS